MCALAPWNYGSGDVRKLVHMLKYERVKAAAVFLGVPLGHYAEKSLALGKIALTNAVIVPIPLHRTKLRKRGFNQSLLIARSLGFRDIPIYDAALLRSRPVASQTKQKGHEMRTENVAGSFAVRDPEALRGKTVLLVDDVITSGATMREAALVMRRAGAKRVIGIAVARA